jgi:Tannase and feruloyl esterase
LTAVGSILGYSSSPKVDFLNHPVDRFGHRYRAVIVGEPKPGKFDFHGDARSEWTPAGGWRGVSRNKHSAGGPGANFFGNIAAGPGGPVDAAHDLFTALDQWVETGAAPNKVIATKYTNDDPTQPVLFQRPLCVYPKISHYNGGDANSASSFSCVPDVADHTNDVQRATRYLTEYGDVLYNPPSPPAN